MTAYFLDSSAVVKAFVVELGSPWVLGIVNATAEHEIYIARLTAVEVTAALVRRSRAGSISQATLLQSLSDLRHELQSRFALVEATAALVTRAMVIAESRALRGYDCLQLAAAILTNEQLMTAGLPGLTFVTADAELVAAGTAEGLAVDNPNDH